MIIAQALELPVKINITGDPQKDAEIVLYALAACVGLLILCILLLVIIAVRRSRKRKKQALMLLQKAQAAVKAAKEKEAESAAVSENPHTNYQPAPKEEVAQPVATSPAEETATPLPEEKPVIPEPAQKPVNTEMQSHAPEIHIEEDPEKKMEEIRRRIAEIAEKRKTESEEYKEIELPKLDADYGKEQFVQAHKWEIESNTVTEFPETDFTEYAPEDHDLQATVILHNEADETETPTGEQAATEPEQTEAQESAPATAEAYTDTNTAEAASVPEEVEQHSTAEQNNGTALHIPAQEEPVTLSETQVPESLNIADPKELDIYFQNTQLPLKRLTFAEWVDQFKK